MLPGYAADFFMWKAMGDGTSAVHHAWSHALPYGQDPATMETVGS